MNDQRYKELSIREFAKAANMYGSGHPRRHAEADHTEGWNNPSQEGVHSGEQDASIVACHMMLRAQELGIGSVWVNAFSNDEAARAFGLPEAEKVVLMMPLGHPAEGAKPAKWHSSKLAACLQYETRLS